jgi:hypothetical protein
MGDIEKVTELITETVRQAWGAGDGKSFFILARAPEGGGWRFVIPSSMTGEDVNDAIDEAFKNPPMRIAKTAGTA